jgi:putative transposase
MRIVEIAKTRIRYGFRRIFILLRREGVKDNHRHVYRIYKEEGLNLRTKRPRRNRVEAHRLERVENNSLNKVWSMDFVQEALFNVSRFRILSIVDNYSKKCLGLAVGKSMKGADVVGQLEGIKHLDGLIP